ncbi:polysaccharide biosynthesis/export family protein [Sphingomonas sp. KR3-1]|uniref:polysaccharide biosynthesis/export family protein n=1 Tax=Sphingomonas sp. KR3-1 TaxID=3156611 RepID=UPI0032B36847
MLNIRLILVGSLLLSGCASSRIEPDGSVTRLEGTTMPAPDRTDLTAVARPYYIGPFDELSIDVVGINEIPQREIQVDASGRLSFPFVGTIEASGKTPAEVAKLIENGLRARYIRDPQVTINLTKTVSQVVTVDGEVKEPGMYPVLGHMSLLRAVAAAKGTTEFAKLDDVVVLRTVQGKTYAALYNLKALRQGAYADPEVFANDIVMVGDSRARHIFKDLLSVLPLLTTPLVVALQ